MLAQQLIIILAIIFLGIFSEKRKIFNASHIEGLEHFIIKIALPCYLFAAALHYHFSTLIQLDYIYSYLLSFAVIAAITSLAFWRSHTPPRLCIKILASGYVNSAIYSLPMITFLLGDPKAAIVSNLLQVIIIQSIFIALLSFFNPQEKSLWKKIFFSFANPLVAMPLMGLTLNYYQFIPHPIITAVTNNLGNSVSSLALFTFGLSLSSIKFNKEILNKDLLFIILIKNLIHPLAAFFIGVYLFHLEGYWLNALIISASAPTAFVIYLIAKQFSIDQYLIRLAIASSSITSLLSLVFIIWVM